MLPATPVRLKELLDRLLYLARSLGADIKDVELHIVNDAQIAALNQKFMKRAGPTNILSFPGGADMPGQLVLSLDSLARECKLYGQCRRTHLFNLLVHGIAHLAGFEHGPDMEEFTNKLSSLCAG